YETTYYYWLKSYDTSGNASSESASVSTMPNRTAAGDIVDAIQSENFVSGVSGWYIGFRGVDDGYAEFNDVTVRGILTAGEIHIPDQDVTGDSFHVQPDGDTWWGCTETDFNADPDNALAYVLKTGIAKFQNIALGGAAGSVALGYTNSDVFIINFDEDDVDVELRFGRATGGAASITWNGVLVQCSKALKPVDLGINNISASAPGSPFAGQVWLDVS
ncbi:hypothetical protein KKH23_05740, partial [Patescibacteria group bacterium]|nr:hypothetical protein [Patescibacteria group bacterium]